MSVDIFIGVDGGASSCKVRIEDAAGNCLGLAKGGPTTIKFSTAKAWQTILETIAIALTSTAIKLDDKRYHFHLGCGLTGCELPEPCAKFLHEAPSCFKDVQLKSDAYTACLGAHAGKDGAIIIIGTGMVSVQIQQRKMIQIGGWGFPHSDEGSGAWLGMEAVRLTLQWLDGRFASSATTLLEKIFKQFDHDLTKLVVWANAANSTKFAEITPLIIEHLKQEDPLAVKLIRCAADEIDRIGVALAKRTTGDKLLPCCLCGGLTPFVEPYIAPELKARIVLSKHDAAKGAIFMVKEILNFEF